MTGIIFYPLTVAHLLHHHQIKAGEMLKTLRFQQFVLFPLFRQRQLFSLKDAIIKITNRFNPAGTFFSGIPP
jgi:hypothetical protein